MGGITIKCNEALIPLRNILDEITTGREVVIQQHDEPVAVVVPYERWKALKIASAFTEATQILAKIKRGESQWVSSDEVMQAVLARRNKRLAREQTANMDAAL